MCFPWFTVFFADDSGEIIGIQTTNQATLGISATKLSIMYSDVAVRSLYSIKIMGLNPTSSMLQIGNGKNKEKVESTIWFSQPELFTFVFVAHGSRMDIFLPHTISGAISGTVP